MKGHSEEAQPTKNLLFAVDNRNNTLSLSLVHNSCREEGMA